MNERIEDCIDRYLEKYDIVLENFTYKSKDTIEGSLRLFNAEKKFGHISYVIDKKTKNLHVTYVSTHKPAVKFAKILLAYLLSTYSRHIETVTLSTTPGTTYRKGGDFCFVYQKLGFEPYELKAKQKIDNYLKKYNIPSVQTIRDMYTIYTNKT